MPSELLENLYVMAIESLKKNASSETKIALLNGVICQADDEIKTCEETINQNEAIIFILSPTIKDKIKLKNEINLTKFEKNKITKLREKLEKLLLEQQALINQPDQLEASCNDSDEDSGTNQMKIFISHSEKDSQIAESLINYFQSALFLVDDDIRCTSVPGHKLSFGKNIAAALRDDLSLAPILIALVTEESISATWVMFELGAAWGLKRDIIPILAPGVKINDLPSLLSSIPCILIDNSDASSRLSGLVNQLSTKLELKIKSGEKTQSNLENFVSLFRRYKSRKSEKVGTQLEPENTGNTNESENDFKDIEELVLAAIIDLDNSEYYRHGYKIERISEKTNLNISKCKLALTSLIRREYIKKHDVYGPNHNGEHFEITENGQHSVRNKILSK